MRKSHSEAGNQSVLSKSVVHPVVAHWEHTRNRHYGHATSEVGRGLANFYPDCRSQSYHVLSRILDAASPLLIKLDTTYHIFQVEIFLPIASFARLGEPAMLTSPFLDVQGYGHNYLRLF